MQAYARVKAWLKWFASDLFYRWVPRRLPSSSTVCPGVNLIGFAHAEMGLGEALRNTAWALDYAHIPFIVRKLNISLLNRQENRSLQHLVGSKCRYEINCIGINPDLLYRLPFWISYTEWGGRYNVGYWFWELPNFPQAWRYACHLVDEVWVNTDFVANAVRQAHKKVHKIPFAIDFDTPDAVFNRQYFQLPEKGFIFLFSYDFNSSFARKNPQAVIEAFRMAFPDTSAEVCLVVKSINGEQNQKALADLKALLCNDARINFVDEYLSTEEMRGLLNTADVYVSLHRSEGLGLGMAESMYLGKPVIGTAYSGNMEFMNSENSCLVPFKLIPVKAGEYPFHKGQQWADPDISAAAAWMIRLESEPDLIQAIGQRASAYMRQHHARDVMGRAIQARVAEIDSGFGKLSKRHTGMADKTSSGNRS